MCCLHNKETAKPASRAFVQTIKKTSSFKAVYAGGSQAANAYFVVYALPNNSCDSRLGLSISKKVGNAVKRNRIRRWVKEICRLNANRIANGFDIVVIVRVATGALPMRGSYQKVDKALEALFVRLKLFKVEDKS